MQHPAPGLDLFFLYAAGNQGGSRFVGELTDPRVQIRDDRLEGGEYLALGEAFNDSVSQAIRAEQ